MRFRRHQPPLEDTNIDLAPMLDFIMNLLIFFIVAAAFIQETGIKVNRPTAKTATQDDQTNILVAISAKGEIWIDRQHVDIRALRALIQKQRAEHPEASVIIQADKDARAGLLVEAMDQARLAGVKDVAVAAQPLR
ncbi:MAG TPA: biopolymer transporter ExbD [Solimonas sp.]|nr:biopolymer transporter ExbD [Solimonas sp.]